MLELIRGKTGRVYGNLVAMLTILKAQPSTYNRDLQEDKVAVFDAADTISACVEMATAIVSHTKFNDKKIAAGLDEGFLDATALAEYLVGKGVAFRTAHRIVGELVAECEKQGTKLGDVTLDRFRQVSDAIGEDVYECLRAANVPARYVTEGSAGPAEAARQIEYWEKKLAQR